MAAKTPARPAPGGYRSSHLDQGGVQEARQLAAVGFQCRRLRRAVSASMQAGPEMWGGSVVGRHADAPSAPEGPAGSPFSGVQVGADRLDHPQAALGRMAKDGQ